MHETETQAEDTAGRGSSCESLPPRTEGMWPVSVASAWAWRCREVTEGISAGSGARQQGLCCSCLSRGHQLLLRLLSVAWHLAPLGLWSLCPATPNSPLSLSSFCGSPHFLFAAASSPGEPVLHGGSFDLSPAPRGAVSSTD